MHTLKGYRLADTLCLGLVAVVERHLDPVIDKTPFACCCDLHDHLIVGLQEASGMRRLNVLVGDLNNGDNDCETVRSNEQDTRHDLHCRMLSSKVVTTLTISLLEYRSVQNSSNSPDSRREASWNTVLISSASICKARVRSKAVYGRGERTICLGTR